MSRSCVVAMRVRLGGGGGGTGQERPRPGVMSLVTAVPTHHALTLEPLEPLELARATRATRAMLLPTLLTLTLTLCPCLGLILREVTVPPFILAGDTASLGCQYDAQVRQ